MLLPRVRQWIGLCTSCPLSISLGVVDDTWTKYAVGVGKNRAQLQLLGVRCPGAGVLSFLQLRGILDEIEDDSHFGTHVQSGILQNAYIYP